MSTSSGARFAEDLTLDTASEVSSTGHGARTEVRLYIESIRLGTFEDSDDRASRLDAGILGSTGTTELVAYRERECGLSVADEDITAVNLEPVDRICALLERGRTAGK